MVGGCCPAAAALLLKHFTFGHRDGFTAIKEPEQLKIATSDWSVRPCVSYTTVFGVLTCFQSLAVILPRRWQEHQHGRTEETQRTRGAACSGVQRHPKHLNHLI